MTNMNLCHSLFFNKIDNLPVKMPENGEFLLCFELNPSQSRNIEPDPDHFLDNLLFTGEKIQDDQAHELVELPQGHYLFSQFRSDAALDRDKWLDLAIEQQKDGLWERYKLTDFLFIRFLYEDGAFVTQIFRKITDGVSHIII
ncbi:MAG: hypothetical protein FWB77_02685 [Treponema sp.]|nr:hypothetical protein [Treponema sp.]